MTWDGHEFLDSVKNNGIWNKTKEGMLNKGLELSSVPLYIVKEYPLYKLKVYLE